MKIWNRTPIENENVLPLTDLTEENLKDLDLVIEVAHPQIVQDYAGLILNCTNLFIGSPTALADDVTFKTINEKLKQNPERRVFVPAGAFWGGADIQKMADFGTLKVIDAITFTFFYTLIVSIFQGLTITMIKHPNSLKVLGELDELCQRAKKTNTPTVLFDGTLFIFPSFHFLKLSISINRSRETFMPPGTK